MEFNTKRVLRGAVCVVLLMAGCGDDDDEPPGTGVPATGAPATDPPPTDPPPTDPPAPSVMAGMYSVEVDLVSVPGTSGGTYTAVYVFAIDPSGQLIMSEQQGSGQQTEGVYFAESNTFWTAGSDGSSYAEWLAGMIKPDTSELLICTWGGPAELVQLVVCRGFGDVTESGRDQREAGVR
jgi:hypothetical protein